LADTLPVDVLKRLRAERDARLRQPGKPTLAASATATGTDTATKAQAHKQFFAAYDRYLDQALCVRWLKNLAVAEIIIGNLYHHHQVKYQLLEYTVMPNHVHVLFVPIIADAGSIGHEKDAGRVGHKTDAGSISHVPDAASVRIQTVTSNEPNLDYFSDEVTDTESPLSKIMHSLKSYTANEANNLLSRDGRFWQRESYDHWVRDDAELARIAEYIANNAVSAKLAENAWDWPHCSAHDRKHPRDKPLAEWW
jgi:REP element-mobilizing transposase RayT